MWNTAMTMKHITFNWCHVFIDWNDYNIMIIDRLSDYFLFYQKLWCQYLFSFFVLEAALMTYIHLTVFYNCVFFVCELMWFVIICSTTIRPCHRKLGSVSSKCDTTNIPHIPTSCTDRNVKHQINIISALLCAWNSYVQFLHEVGWHQNSKIAPSSFFCAERINICVGVQGLRDYKCLCCV